MQTPRGAGISIKEALNGAVRYLENRHSSSPRLDAEVILCYVRQCSRANLYCDSQEYLSRELQAQFDVLIKRRGQQEPVAYIIGRKEFYGFDFLVTRDVLIPRPDTEVLVEIMLSCHPQDGSRILDLGTGSGCIAIALAANLPNTRVVGWDISQKAIYVAQENQRRLQADVRFHCLDFSDKLAWSDSVFDYIVSNPPYICPQDRKDLPISVAEFEPLQALYADEQGYYFYKKIAVLASRHLRPGGGLFLEIGVNQKDGVEKILDAAGWKNITTTNDLSGIPRVTQGWI